MHRSASEHISLAKPTNESARRQKNKFFDPRKPAQPEQVLGVDTEDILKLGRAVTNLGILPPKVDLGLYTLPNAVRLLPLIEEMQSGVEIDAEDIRPYRKPIKKLPFGLNFADKVAATAGVIGVGIPVRKALNRKIERDFPGVASEAVERAREALSNIEDEVNFVAGFENPKQQFESEINELADTVSQSISEQRDLRVRSNRPAETPSEDSPRGILGLFTKAVHAIKRFFGIFSREPRVNQDITAYDAGAGLEQTFKSIIGNIEASAEHFPLLSKFVLPKLPKDLPVTKDKLALIAPEILNFLFSTSTKESKESELMSSVIRNPHELRFVTKFKKRYGRFDLERIQTASHTLIPAIRDILPDEGSKITDIYTAAKDLLQPIKDSPGAKETKIQPKQKGLLKRLKGKFSRSK